ncbi:MAG: hypothetical protein JWM35_2284, partial [Verrucomicrobia bacterium]|nr:hypothetical protein [Verrucomicrobiota bacterium]
HLRTVMGPALLCPGILLALLGGAFALMLIIALVDITSFSAAHAIYLAPATPLILATWVLAPAWAARLIIPPTTQAPRLP